MKHALTLCIPFCIAACTVTWNPISPINSTVYGRNGNIRVFMNYKQWNPDSVATVNVRDTSQENSSITNHISITGWSDGYKIHLDFVMPDTLDHGAMHAYVIGRNATVDFSTPWPLQNVWLHSGDSIGVMTATRIDDSTVSGYFGGKYQSAITTYYLENCGFTTRIRIR